MSRRELVQSIVTGLPAGSDVVVHPDHPLLFQGPDVLAATGGVLTAYFVFVQPTGQISTQLLPRVVLSRLALPMGTTFVLVMSASVTLADEYSSFFEEIVSVDSGRQITMPIGRMHLSAGAETIDSLRIFHHERFAEAWAFATRGRHFTRRTPGEPTALYGQRAPRLTPAVARYASYQHGQFVFSTPGSETGIPRSWLSMAINLVVRTDYGLGGGLSVLRQIGELTLSRDTHLALHKSWLPVVSYANESDALKRLRTAAFAGIVTQLEQRYVE